jgi:hypothetical protein
MPFHPFAGACELVPYTRATRACDEKTPPVQSELNTASLKNTLCVCVVFVYLTRDMHPREKAKGKKAVHPNVQMLGYKVSFFVLEQFCHLLFFYYIQCNFYD